MALEPVTETIADENSYGFRRKRSTADAIDALHKRLSKKCAPQWILEGDIKGCFDHISHKWLIEHIQIEKIKKDANPFDSGWNAYFENRSSKVSKILRRTA